MSVYWDDIRKHYAKANSFILKTPRNEWAIDPYAWNGVLELTPIEQALWCDIRQADAVLYPQYPIGKVFVDFANPKAKVAIECDGHHFHLDKEKDAQRDALLQSQGWHVYRISGSGCMTEQDDETGEKSIARRFIDVICSNHRIALGEKKQTSFSFQQSICVYVNTLCEVYL